MSATLTLNNYSQPNILETSSLSAKATAAQATATLSNVQNFTANDYVILGTLGSETSEMLQVLSVAGNVVTFTSNLKFDHAQFAPATKIFGNQLTVYRAANISGIQPADSAYAIFSGSTVAIDVDQLSTLFTDPNGSSAFWYKYVFTNSTTTTSTSLSASSSGRGEGFANYCSVDDVREAAGFSKAAYVTDQLIYKKLTAAQDEINSSLGGYYTVPFVTPINAFIADVTTRLAAGLLLLEQYGAFGTQNTHNGQSKVDGARSDIKRIQNGGIVLKDATGTSIANPDNGGYSAIPNGDTENTTTGAGGPMFIVEERY